MDYKGRTALVTGASSGIGLEYANELAKRGANLVLVARRKDQLEALADKLRTEHGVAVTTIDLDLATLNSGQELVERVAAAGLTPEIVINNAGFGTNNRLENEDRNKIQQEVVLNVATLVDLTTAFLPSMLTNNFGAIVNIASTAAYQPVPGMAVYAATKAFVLSFTSALWGEVQGTNVRVLTVSPGATATEFFEVAQAKPFGNLAPVRDVVYTTFRALDAKAFGPAVIVGGRNWFMASVSRLLPTSLVIRVAAGMFLPKK